MVESPRDISGLGLEELRALLLQALEETVRLKTENAALREEIARLKGLKGRPKLKPSGMEHALGLDPIGAKITRPLSDIAAVGAVRGDGGGACLWLGATRRARAAA